MKNNPLYKMCFYAPNINYNKHWSVKCNKCHLKIKTVPPQIHTCAALTDSLGSICGRLREEPSSNVLLAKICTWKILILFKYCYKIKVRTYRICLPLCIFSKLKKECVLKNFNTEQCSKSIHYIKTTTRIALNQYWHSIICNQIFQFHKAKFQKKCY